MKSFGLLKQSIFLNFQSDGLQRFLDHVDFLLIIRRLFFFLLHIILLYGYILVDEGLFSLKFFYLIVNGGFILIELVVNGP